MPLLLSEVFNGAQRKQFKAPRGMMYEITWFNMTNFFSASQAFIIVDYLTEEAPIILSDDAEYLVFVDLAIDGLFASGSLDNHRTKFLTMGSKDNAGSLAVGIQLFGKLVKASRSELIWEWFRKGR